MRVAQVLRKDISENDFSFNGCFKPGCEKDVVPDSALALVRMILNGSNHKTKHQMLQQRWRFQFLMFNVKTSMKKGVVSKIFMTKEEKHLLPYILV